MTNELEAYEGELKSLRDKIKLYDKIFLHSFAADKLGDIYFICGEAGAKDDNNLPNQIYICPAYGCDWFQVYTKTDITMGPEY